MSENPIVEEDLRNKTRMGRQSLATGTYHIYTDLMKYGPDSIADTVSVR